MKEIRLKTKFKETLLSLRGKVLNLEREDVPALEVQKLGGLGSGGYATSSLQTTGRKSSPRCTSNTLNGQQQTRQVWHMTIGIKA